jgi:hypothetical protein
LRRWIVEDLYGLAGNDQLLVDAHTATAHPSVTAALSEPQGERHWS